MNTNNTHAQTQTQTHTRTGTHTNTNTNGAWMMSWLSDQAEFVGRSIPDHGQDYVKI